MFPEIVGRFSIANHLLSVRSGCVATHGTRRGGARKWLDNRRIELAREIEYERYHKESLRERFEQEMYYADKWIAEPQKELDSLG